MNFASPLAACTAVAADDATPITVDLPAQQVRGAGVSASFAIDSFRKDCLLRGLDQVGLTLQQADAIHAYESKRRAAAPWLFASN